MPLTNGVIFSSPQCIYCKFYAVNIILLDINLLLRALTSSNTIFYFPWEVWALSLQMYMYICVPHSIRWNVTFVRLRSAAVVVELCVRCPHGPMFLPSSPREFNRRPAGKFLSLFLNWCIMSNAILSIARTIHRGQERFYDISGGRQCSFMSFSALLCAQSCPVRHRDTATVDLI